MAIYHCSIKIISRGKGKSAVAAAAYRAGEEILNEYDGITHDYSRLSGHILKVSRDKKNLRNGNGKRS